MAEMKKHEKEEGKKDLKETTSNEVGYTETKAPVSSADASALAGLPPIAPPGSAS